MLDDAEQSLTGGFHAIDGEIVADKVKHLLHVLLQVRTTSASDERSERRSRASHLVKVIEVILQPVLEDIAHPHADLHLRPLESGDLIGRLELAWRLDVEALHELRKEFPRRGERAEHHEEQREEHGVCAARERANIEGAQRRFLLHMTMLDRSGEEGVSEKAATRDPHHLGPPW